MHPYTVVDDHRDALFNQTAMSNRATLDSGTLVQFMVNAFNRILLINVFSKGQELMHRTWGYRFYSKDFRKGEFY